MQKLINDPDAFVEETIDGILAAHGHRLRRADDDPRVLIRAGAPVAGKVAIVTGGGSGHLPLFLGYVGEGLADAVAVGNVFASPSAEQMMAATRGADGGAGVLYLFGNYGGDVMNFSLAAELIAAEGVRVETVVGADDVASAPKGEEGRRRGIAGIFFLYKVAGARAAEGASLDEVTDATRHAAANVRSMGVALAPCIVPAAGRPTFEVPEGEMEIGMGIHGEPGVRRGLLEPADAIADDLVAAILADLPHERGDKVDVLVNGLGSTPVEELYILYRRIAEAITGAGLTVRRVWVGEYATSLEMAGASVSILRSDPELARLMDAPASTPLFDRF
jgi:phosphoenolpyruvate---glycerone phosphotransferase subunit DhaK